MKSKPGTSCKTELKDQVPEFEIQNPGNEAMI